MGVSEKQLKTTSMPINQDLLAKGFRNLLILLGLLIASPLDAILCASSIGVLV